MNANDLIEAYVSDVAAQLPRKQRNDVAFELRQQLQEELQARAEATGREPDAVMAMEMLHAFGRPSDVAGRYRPARNVIDPADGDAFLRATVIGMAIIWFLGLLRFAQNVGAGVHMLSALGIWWVGAVIPSLWWPGFLVVGFAMSAWVRRRWPQTSAWKPLGGDLTYGARAGMVIGVVGILCGVYVLVEPRVILDVFLGGRAAPAAYEALTYSETFRSRQGPWLLALLLVNIPILVRVIVQGRDSTLIRRTEDVQSFVLSLVMIWTVLDGPVFVTEAADRTTKFFLVLISAATLGGLGFKQRRSVRPAPDEAARRS
jgi:hypothetical protein